MRNTVAAENCGVLSHAADLRTFSWRAGLLFPLLAWNTHWILIQFLNSTPQVLVLVPGF